MKKVFLEKLPKYENGRYKNKINWGYTINYYIEFIYDDIRGKIKIVKYYKENNKYYLKIKYNNNYHVITPGNLIYCRLGNILGKINHLYLYKIDETIEINSSKLKILKQIKIKDNENYNRRVYKYRCLICGNEDIIRECDLKNKKQSCNVCNNHKIKIGYNDMWTTNPELASKLVNPQDGYKYMQNTNKSVNWKCPDCGNIIKNKRIANVNIYGLSCPKCSDKLPYPEKFVFNFLQQLNIEFTYQLSKTIFKWCENYKYDFYFKLNDENYVLETHGLEHYKKGFSNIKFKGRIKNLREIQENDKIKKNLALENGIKEENYIIIDCGKSKLEWIKNSILRSKLNNIFDLSKIDWLQCHKYACSNLVKKACNLWDDKRKTIVQIAKIMKLSKNTIRKYLKQGNLIGWCNYDPIIAASENGKKNGGQLRRKVICLNNKKVFNSIVEAGKYYNIKSLPNITRCCKNKRNHCGKDPITGEQLCWMYYDKYLEILKC